MAIGVDALYGSHPEHLHNAVAAGELSINGTFGAIAKTVVGHLFSL